MKISIIGFLSQLSARLISAQSIPPHRGRQGTLTRAQFIDLQHAGEPVTQIPRGGMALYRPVLRRAVIHVLVRARRSGALSERRNVFSKIPCADGQNAESPGLN